MTYERKRASLLISARMRKRIWTLKSRCRLLSVTSPSFLSIPFYKSR